MELRQPDRQVIAVGVIGDRDPDPARPRAGGLPDVRALGSPRHLAGGHRTAGRGAQRG
ncbi:MAG TPA: hypothetical protein VGH53_27750 [Streptosporangiaceae bacterium]